MKKALMAAINKGSSKGNKKSVYSGDNGKRRKEGESKEAYAKRMREKNLASEKEAVKSTAKVKGSAMAKDLKKKRLKADNAVIRTRK